MTDVTFGTLGVPQPLVAALAAEGKTTAFPIQVDTLPDTLAGRDVLGRGKTGSHASSRKGGRLGGCASARRPAAARSASARKAARTRKRHAQTDLDTTEGGACPAASNARRPANSKPRSGSCPCHGP